MRLVEYLGSGLPCGTSANSPLEHLQFSIPHFGHRESPPSPNSQINTGCALEGVEADVVQVHAFEDF